MEYNPNLECYNPLCELVSGFYLTDRYPPFTDLDLTCEDIKQNIPKAQKLIQALLQEIKL